MKKEEQVFIDIPNANLSLMQSFPNDPNSDIQLIFKSKHYRLQKSIITSCSKYFQRFLTPNMSIFEIKANFDEQVIEKILQIMYGNAIGIDRLQVITYYQVAKYLQIQHIQQVLLKDINDCFQQYDTFAIMKLAHDTNNDGLFKKCIDELQSQSFQQMKYYQLSLLQMDFTLFKLVIKSHNIYKQTTRKGLSLNSINNLIKLYCESHNKSQEEMQKIKVDLLDVSLLTAAQFKQIMMEPITKKINQINSSKSLNKSQQSWDVKFKRKVGIVLCKLQQLNNSQQPSIHNFKQMKLYLQNIYLKKLNEQLQKQNNKIWEQLKKQGEKTSHGRRYSVHTKIDKIQHNKEKEKETVKIKQKEVIGKDDGKKEEKDKKQINQFLSVIDKLSSEFEQKIEEIASIVDLYEKKKRQKMNKKNILDLSSSQSGLFLSCNHIHQMMSRNKQTIPIPKLKKFKTMHIDIIQSMSPQFESSAVSHSIIIKDNKIEFQQIPTCLQSHSFQALYSLIRPEGFIKINLSLVYRRSRIGSSVGFKSDIFGHSSLLVLFRTSQGVEIGGCVSQPLDASKNQNSDQNAFVFNLKKADKYQIIPQLATKALLISDQWLINFGNDLLIPNESLSQKCTYTHCNYRKICSQKQNQKLGNRQQDKNKKKVGILENMSSNSSLESISSYQNNSGNNISEGLELPSSFTIEVLQIFAIRETDMEMVL